MCKSTKTDAKQVVGIITFSICEIMNWYCLRSYCRHNSPSLSSDSATMIILFELRFQRFDVDLFCSLSASRQINSVNHAAYSFCRIEDCEQLKVYISEALAALSGVQARIMDRLRALASPNSSQVRYQSFLFDSLLTRVSIPFSQ